MRHPLSESQNVQLPRKEVTGGSASPDSRPQQPCCLVIRKHSLPDRIVVDFPSTHVVVSGALMIPNLKE